MPNGALSHQSFSSVWRAWEERFVMERYWGGIPTACWWRRPAGLPVHTHRWTTCQGNCTHTDQRPPSRPEVRGNGTERDEEEWEKELITALMLHFIIVSWARLITLTASTVYTAPPSLSFSYVTVDWPTMSLSLRVTGTQVAWHVYGRDSQSTIWKLLILEGDSSGRQ